MSWQDIGLTLGGVYLVISLIPTLRGPKPSRLTAAMIALITAFYTVIDASLSLWFAALVTLVQGVLWAVIAVQARGECP